MWRRRDALCRTAFTIANSFTEMVPMFSDTAIAASAVATVWVYRPERGREWSGYAERSV
jgi:hypothetical protein